MQTRCPDNMISISETSLVFGKGISNFLDKYNINSILYIMNHNNDSIVVKGTTENYGIKIQRDRWNYYTITRILKFIDFSNLGNYKVARQAYRTIAVPLSKNSILIPNVKLKKIPLTLGNKLYIDIQQKLIIAGNFSPSMQLDLKINLNDLVKQPKPSPISPSIKSKVTATPSPPISHLTATPSSLKTPATHMPDRDIATLDPLEMPAENQPSQDEIESADKEYSKMILGE